jgi:hypothetical protein
MVTIFLEFMLFPFAIACFLNLKCKLFDVETARLNPRPWYAGTDMAFISLSLVALLTIMFWILFALRKNNFSTGKSAEMGQGVKWGFMSLISI